MSPGCPPKEVLGYVTSPCASVLRHRRHRSIAPAPRGDEGRSEGWSPPPFFRSTRLRWTTGSPCAPPIYAVPGCGKQEERDEHYHRSVRRTRHRLTSIMRTMAPVSPSSWFTGGHSAARFGRSRSRPCSIRVTVSSPTIVGGSDNRASRRPATTTTRSPRTCTSS